LSRALEGLNRHASTHAAGVVISDIPLIERVPLCVPKDDIVTQFTMNDIQAVGLTKFDFLGLKTLTVIKNVLRLVKEGRGEDIDIDSLPLSDSKTYELLSRGDTDGVFQLESTGMREILTNLKPDCIEDIIALIALYRPGPMNMVPEFISRKQRKTKINYVLPQLREILSETYGIILYQEQVMQIAVIIGGYSLSEADTLRKVMSKKNTSEMEKEKPKFLVGAQKNNIPPEKALNIWDQIKDFAEYGFNKSHSTAYAMISYQTAYLKTHYAVEFMAALLTSEKDNRDKIIKYINCCKELGIKVLPPDINESVRDFNVTETCIRFGLAAIKNVGMGSIDAILSARSKLGKFSSLTELCNNVDFSKVNKRVFESLIKCGAFDSLGYRRKQLIGSYESIIESAQKRRKEELCGQSTLFNDFGEMRGNNQHSSYEYLADDTQEWDIKEILYHEKDTMGFYISSHPLSRFVDKLAFVTNIDSEKISEMKDKDIVSFAGNICSIKEITTRKKELMAYIDIEDLKGTINVIFFPDVYKKYAHLLHTDETILIKGSIDVGEESAKVIASEFHILDEYLKTTNTVKVSFKINSSNAKENTVDLLKEIIRTNKGNHQLYLNLQNDKFETVIDMGNNYRINISEEIIKEVDGILGTNSTVLC
jgi:DNA polymerase III subunit alpha